MITLGLPGDGNRISQRIMLRLLHLPLLQKNFSTFFLAAATAAATTIFIFLAAAAAAERQPWVGWVSYYIGKSSSSSDSSSNGSSCLGLVG